MAKYTDDQINEAIMLANKTGKVHSWKTEMYRNVIKHLPEPGKTHITNVGIYQQIERLLDLTSSAHGAALWLTALNHLVATGAEREALLPEPATDEWVECGFNDFRPTDKRVKALFIGGSIIEGTPDRRNSEHVFLVDGPVIHSYDDATFYRIPAPVQHPDPKEHRYILDEDGDLWAWSENRQVYVEPNTGVTGPTDGFIEGWTPADVVPKVVEDDR